MRVSIRRFFHRRSSHRGLISRKVVSEHCPGRPLTHLDTKVDAVAA